MVDSKTVLSHHGISRTSFRIDLLNLFLKSQKSFSVNGIIEKFSNSVNMPTIYRALDHFEKQGLIHKVPDTDGLKKYALCKHNECNASAHNHNHGHFICYNCNQTFCLDELNYAEVKWLKGFYIQELKLTAEGYCKDCHEN